MTLGQRIRTLRTEKKLTQAQLAGEQITRNMLSQIENDAAAPSVRTLEYLAHRLGVGVSELLGSEPETAWMEQAREQYRAGHFAEAYRLAEQAMQSEERSLLLALAGVRLAADALEAGESGKARSMAARALEQNRHCLYASSVTEWQALRIMVQCDFAEGRPAAASVERFRKSSEREGWEAKYHLLLAREHLCQEHLSAAEREIWSVTMLPPEDKPEYLLLRGRLALGQEKYANALPFLRQAEALGVHGKNAQRELYTLLETACRETEDRRGAQEYAEKLRAL